MHTHQDTHALSPRQQKQASLFRITAQKEASVTYKTQTRYTPLDRLRADLNHFKRGAEKRSSLAKRATLLEGHFGAPTNQFIFSRHQFPPPDQPSCCCPLGAPVDRASPPLPLTCPHHSAGHGGRPTTFLASAAATAKPFGWP